MANDPQSQAPRDREVAEWQGIGESSVWRLTKNGKLPQSVKIGGSTRWRRSAIEALARKAV